MIKSKAFIGLYYDADVETLQDALDAEMEMKARAREQRDRMVARCNTIRDQRTAAEKECGRLQARIDELMMEYCYEEMTDEQLKRWAACQKMSKFVDPVEAVMKPALEGAYSYEQYRELLEEERAKTSQFQQERDSWRRTAEELEEEKHEAERKLGLECEHCPINDERDQFAARALALADMIEILHCYIPVDTYEKVVEPLLAEADATSLAEHDKALLLRLADIADKGIKRSEQDLKWFSLDGSWLRAKAEDLTNG